MEIIKSKILKWIDTEDFFKKSQEEKESAKIHETFLEKFNIENIEKLKIDDYIVGKNNENSFCNMVENKLKFFGEISGRTTAYQKFVLYWNEAEQKYLFGDKRTKQRKSFGADVDEIFSNIKKYLKQLIINAKNNDYEEISKNPLNRLFKNKVSFLYSKDQIPIYSDNHLNIILKEFKISFEIVEKVEFKRKKLWNFYNENFSNILSPSLFMCFIYSSYGFEKLFKNNPTNDPILEDLKVQPSDVDNLSKKSRKIINPSFNTEIKKYKNGKEAEGIVLKYLEKNKTKLRIKDLKIWCFGENQDDSKGYDFSFITKENEEYFIEAKSTISNSKNKVNFFMSKNEWEVMDKNRNKYFIYYIEDLNNNKNKIKRISANDIGIGQTDKIFFNLDKVK